MRIYTRTGDGGMTGLSGGERIPKSDPLMEAVGTIDELNAAVGVARSHLGPGALADPLSSVQGWLFELGAEVAAPQKKRHFFETLDESHVQRLEQWIDELADELEELRNFILPGGAKAAAHLHLARAVCRRAERSIVELSQIESVRPVVLQFLNRLSDWLFVAARKANRDEGVEDSKWNTLGA